MLVLTNNDASIVEKTVYIYEETDLLSKSYNKNLPAGFESTFSVIDGNATLYVFAAGAQSGEGNIIVNNETYTDVWSGTSSSFDVFTAPVASGNISVYFESTGSTILALHQMVVVENDIIAMSSAMKSEYTSVPSIYAGVVNNMTVTVTNKGKAMENVTVKVLIGEEEVGSYSIASLGVGENNIAYVIDSTIRPITENTVNGNNNEKVNYTVVIEDAEGNVIDSADYSFVVLYNGNLGKDYEYPSAAPLMREFTITGDVAMGTGSVYSASDKNLSDVINVEFEGVVSDALLYVSYNWNNPALGDFTTWTILFNNQTIVPIASYKDQGNLGNYGKYAYGLVVYNVTGIVVNGENSLVINRTYKSVAIYPASLLVLTNNDASTVEKTVYIYEETDLLSKTNNKNLPAGFESTFNTVDGNATLYVFAAGAQSSEGNLIINGVVNTNVWSGTSSSFDVFTTDVASGNITVYFESTGSTILALHQMVVVEYVELPMDASVSVLNDTLDLLVGDESTIVATTFPVGLDVTFVPDNSGVVSVDENGTVTAIKEGTAIITVSVGDNVTYALNSTTVTVTVSKVPTEITVLNDTVGLKVADEVDVGASLTLGDAGALVFTSSDENVVKVVDGKIVAVGAGEATVTVSFAGDDKYAAAENKTITVTVSLNDASVSVDNATLDLLIGDESTIVAVTVPEGLNVSFVPDNSGVVSVDENGVVTALKEGTATIIVRVGDNVTYALNSTTVTVTVSKVPTEITVLNDTVGLKVADEVDVGASLTLGDAGALVFTSSDENVVKVVDGKIVAVGAGEATVTVSFAGDDKYAAAEDKTITVTVSLNDASVSVENATLDLLIGDESTIVATATPEGLEVTFTSSDESVATVDEKGVVTALKAGTAIITVTVGDDVVYALNSTTVTVTVSKITPELAVSAEAITYGDKLVVEVTGPADLSKRVTVTVGNESKLVTLKNGSGSVKFSGLDAGTYTIEVTYAGDAVYTKAAANATVKVAKATPTLKATAKAITYGEDLVVEVKAPSDLARRVIVTIDGNITKYVSLIDGAGSVKFKGLGVGVHTIEISYNGDANYKKASINKTVRVSRAVADIKIKAPSVTYGEDVVVNITMPSDVTRRVKVVIDGNISKTVSLKEGIASVKFSDLGIGVHTIEVTYDGDSNYLKSTANKTVRVNKVVPDIQITADDITEGETLVVGVQLPADATRRVDVTVGNVIKTVSLKNGTASAEFSDLEAGSYDVVVSYNGDSIYKAASNSTTVNVKS